MSPRFEPVIGRYLHLDLLGRPHRLYFEEAGHGIPLLCLHTAGSDGRQYRGLLNDARITDRLPRDRVRHAVARQILAAGGLAERGIPADLARLCADDHGVVAALGLERPVVMGCSIGGRVVLHLALRAPGAFRAMVGLESSRACRSVLRHELAASARRAWRRGLRPARVGLVAPHGARRRALGNAVALHAERPRRVQGRPLFLHHRRRHVRDKLDHIDTRAVPALPADRRIRLFLHPRGHAGGSARRTRRQGRRS